MRIAVLLPYSNPHVTGWIDELTKVDQNVKLSVGIAKSKQQFKRDYFRSGLDHISGYHYFFKGRVIRASFYTELKNVNVFISLGLFNIEFVKALLFLPRNCSVFVLSEPFNPVNSRRSIFMRKLYLLLLQTLLSKQRITFLAIGGEDVKRYYSSLGFSQNLFLNFGYFPKLMTACVKRDRKDFVEFLFVGQLIHRKGIDILSLAVAHLHAKHMNWRVNVIGDGPLRERIVDLAASNPNVKYLGVVDDPIELRLHYRSADVLFLPSYFDGWGAVVNEALSQGCSLLLSKYVYASRYLLRHKLNGFLFDPYDLNGLYVSIDRYFGDCELLSKHEMHSLLIFQEWNHVNAARSFYGHLLGEPNMSNQSLLKAV